MKLWYMVIERNDMHGAELDPYVIGPYSNPADAGDDARDGLPPIVYEVAAELFAIEQVWVTVRPPAGFHIPREAVVA